MGRDKAALSLGGQTMLRRAVNTLRAVPVLQDPYGQVMVTIVGERTELDGADRAITDRYPGCGPLGGMEAALDDLERGGEAEWAFFIPVDMPFLASAVIDTLLREWITLSASGARICYVVVDGRPQPLVSMMHHSVLPFIVKALTDGQFKVTAVLKSAGEFLASPYADSIGSAIYTTQVSHDTLAIPGVGWSAMEDQDQLKGLWFLNLNTEQEFREAETLIASLGSIA